MAEESGRIVEGARGQVPEEARCRAANGVGTRVVGDVTPRLVEDDADDVRTETAEGDKSLARRIRRHSNALKKTQSSSAGERGAMDHAIEDADDVVVAR